MERFLKLMYNNGDLFARRQRSLAFSLLVWHRLLTRGTTERLSVCGDCAHSQQPLSHGSRHSVGHKPRCNHTQNFINLNGKSFLQKFKSKLRCRRRNRCDYAGESLSSSIRLSTDAVSILLGRIFKALAKLKGTKKRNRVISGIARKIVQTRWTCSSQDWIQKFEL